jgi:hypothetical protein
MAYRVGRVGFAARSRQRSVGADQPRARPRLSGAPRARACERTRVSGASTVSTAADTSACPGSTGAYADATKVPPKARLRCSGRGNRDRRRAGIHSWRSTTARAEPASTCGGPESGGGGRRLGDAAPRTESFKATRRERKERPGPTREAAQPRTSESVTSPRAQARARGRAESVAVTTLLPCAGWCGGGARRSGDEALPREHDEQVHRDEASA